MAEKLNNPLEKKYTLKEKESPKEETKSENICNEIAELVTELFNSAVSFRKLHLKVTGQGSFAQHKALNEIYDSLPEHGDDIAEQAQGAYEELLKYNEVAPKILNTKEEGIAYTNELKEMITKLQSKIELSELVNTMDETKSSLNSLKYKLLFLS